jgi:phage regulator Rha-like protein
MVSRWLGMRETQARRAQTDANAKEVAMANREQRSNSEKRKPKKEKPKDAPAVSSLKSGGK